MIRSDLLVQHLTTLGITMYAGVPDSLLKPFGQYVMTELSRESHIITADEGAAVGVAIGHYLRTSQPGLVYLQNILEAVGRIREYTREMDGERFAADRER